MVAKVNININQFTEIKYSQVAKSKTISRTKYIE